MRGNDEGWGSTLIVSLLAGAAVLMAAFVAIERRVAEPMLPLGLFRSGAFTGVQIAAFAVSASMFSLFLYLTLYLQNFLGYSAIEAGLRYLPITVGAFVLAPISGMALAKVQARYLMAGGLGLTGVGLLLMGGLSMSSDWTALLAGFIVAGIGVGVLNPVIADVALSVVPKERSGMAAGINDTFRQVGVAVGVAAWGAIFLGVGASRRSRWRAARSTTTRPGNWSKRPPRGRCRRPSRIPAGARDTVRHADRTGFPPRPERDPPDRRDPLPGRHRASRSGWCGSGRSTAASTSTRRSRPSRSPPGADRPGGSANRLRPMRLVTYDAGDGGRAGMVVDGRVVDAWAALGEPHRGSLRELIAHERIDDLRGRIGDTGAPSHPLPRSGCCRRSPTRTRSSASA